MEDLVLFTAILSLILGVSQLFFPGFVEAIDRYMDQLFESDESPKLNFRKISGLLFISISFTLFYLVYKYSF